MNIDPHNICMKCILHGMIDYILHFFIYNLWTPVIYILVYGISQTTLHHHFFQETSYKIVIQLVSKQTEKWWRKRCTTGSQRFSTDSTAGEFDMIDLATEFLDFLQFLASQAKNLLILDLGLILAFPTIIIPALTGLNEQNNQNEFLHLTPFQASWLGELTSFSQSEKLPISLQLAFCLLANQSVVLYRECCQNHWVVNAPCS